MVLVWVVDKAMVLAVLSAVALWLACGGDFGGDD